MGTTYQQIYELASTKFNSYELSKIFQQSQTDYENIMFGFLNSSTSCFIEFSKDDKSLEFYRDDTLQEFTIQLNGVVQDILATYVLLAWIDSENNKLENLRNYLGGDFKLSSSSANMLSALITKRKEVQEILDTKVFKYQYYLQFKNGEY